jgi:hypothetical protein
MRLIRLGLYAGQTPKKRDWPHIPDDDLVENQSLPRFSGMN